MDGVLIINKPSGITSNRVGQKIKQIFSLRKVGHLGTLDPLATGVLPVFMNEATKLAHFLSCQQKEYIAEMRLGIETDTQDAQGEIIRRSDDVSCETSHIRQAVDRFRGEIHQTPPMYSAIKHNGVPLYRLARKGVTVPRRSRSVTVFEIEILSVNMPYIRLRVVCSPGTYIRTLCSDIGKSLCCGAHLTQLKRVRNGNFHIDRSIPFEQCIAAGCHTVLAQHLLPLSQALTGVPEVHVDGAFYRWIKQGNFIKAADIERFDVPDLKAGGMVKLITDGKLGALATVLTDSDKIELPHDRVWKTIKIFNGIQV